MSDVKVSWKDSAALEGPKCDFCSGPLPLGPVAVLDLTAVGRMSEGRAVLMGGEWAACPGCQGLMGIQPGGGGVELEQVRRRHQEAVDRVFRRRGLMERRGLFRSQVFGEGGDR